MRLAHQEDRDLMVPFKSKNKFINLLFVNSQISKVTYKRTLAFFILISLIFIGLSVFFYIQVGSVIQVSQLYYKTSSTICSINSVCNQTITISQTMKAPVYFMYKLQNFYQNHRRYIQSKSNYQLAGNQLDNSQASLCAPYITNSDMKVTKSWNNTPLNASAIASPCGTIAYTFFNDTFALTNQATLANVTINQNGISWPGDQGKKYKRAQNSASNQWVDPQNEHFIVWMRTSGLPNFRKLWGVIQTDLTPGNYSLIITNNYNSKNWDGDRYVILTTNSSVGGKNYWLPSAFLLIGVLGLIAVVFFWKRMIMFKKLDQE